MSQCANYIILLHLQYLVFVLYPTVCVPYALFVIPKIIKYIL